MSIAFFKNNIKTAPYLIVLISILIFLPSLEYGFINLDDTFYVTNNEFIRSLSFQNIIKWFSREYVNLWIPLTIASFSIDYAVWGKMPFGYHFMNLMIHLMNIILIYMFFKRYKYKTLSIFFAVCIFAFHPVQVESVVWISERKNLLAFFFFILSMHVWKSWLKNRRLSHIFIMILLFVSSLISKPLFVLAPILFAIDVFYLEKRDNSNQKNYRISRYAVISCMFLSVIPSSLTLFFHFKEKGLSLPLAYSGMERFFTALTLPWHYFINFFYPLALSINYIPETQQNIFDFRIFFGILSILIFVYYILQKLKNPGDILFWLIWIFITILPVSTIIPINTWMNDRYLYAPLPALGLFLALFIERLSEKISFMKYSGIVLLIPLASITVNQEKLWRDAGILLKVSLEREPGAVQAKIWLLNYYMMKEDFKSAEILIEPILKVIPDSAYVNFCKLIILKRREKYMESFKTAIWAQKLNPDYSGLNRACGNFFMEMGEYKKSIIFYKRIPDNDHYESSQALLEQIQILIDRKDYDLALLAAEKALKLIPDRPEIYKSYAKTLYKKGKHIEALNILMNGVKRHMSNSELRKLLIEFAGRISRRQC